jgi:hypothetical protein
MNKGLIYIAAAACSFHSLFAQPVIVQNPQSRAAAEGAPVAFSVQAQGSGALHYQWQFNGADVPRAVGRAISFVATTSRAGNYSVTVRDASGNASSSLPAQLEVQKRPYVVLQPRNIIVGEHQTAIFDVRLNESGPYRTIQWRHHSPQEPNHPIPEGAANGVNSFHLEIPNCSNNGTYNGLYWVCITNSVGWAVSRRASLIVIGPPRLTAEPQDRSVRQGGTASFSIAIAPDAAGPKTRQWYKEGQPLPGKTGRVLTLFNVQSEDQGIYYCIVSSMGGQTTSYGADLTVY